MGSTETQEVKGKKQVTEQSGCTVGHGTEPSSGGSEVKTKPPVSVSGSDVRRVKLPREKSQTDRHRAWFAQREEKY